MRVTDLVGKRALVTIKEGYNSKVTEVKFIEVSPSGNWVKIMNMHGTKIWKPVHEIALVETLIDLKKGKPEEQK